MPMLDLASLAKDLEQVTQPIEKARGLPAKLYHLPDSLDLERERLFHRGWALIGFAKDVPEKGDAKPIDFLGAPLLLVRDHENQVKVFENVCRHRGMILVEEEKNFQGVIRCPYHSWCYSLDGQLRATPHVGGPGINRTDSIDPTDMGLLEVRTGRFMDMVFVNVSGAAEPFEEWIAPLRNRLSDFVDQPLYPAGGFQLDIRANWKLIVENNAESYHLPWVHPGLNSYSRLEDHYCFSEARRYSGQGSLVYNPQLDPHLAFPDFEGLPDTWDTSSEYPCVFPNAFVSVHRDHVWFGHLDPKAHDHTVERIEIYYATEEAAKGDRLRALREKNQAQWAEILTEDIFVTEGMQKGRGAPQFDGGRFSPEMESPTHCFHSFVADAIAK
jgi:phenylpropionate dioxygenase-like ring-hydroxylating dioxygenase large terminal subunit